MSDPFVSDIVAQIIAERSPDEAAWELVGMSRGFAKRAERSANPRRAEQYRAAADILQEAAIACWARARAAQPAGH